MLKPRSYSYDDSMLPETVSEQDESDLEKELAEKIAARKQRQQKSGTLYIRQTSWLSMCCGVFSGTWQKRFAVLSDDRLVLRYDEKGTEMGSVYLKNCKITLTEFAGHNGKHNCLQIASFAYEGFLSFETNEELREWVIALTYTVESLQRRSGLFNF